MEITEPQLARLVLGYLKREKCTTAFNEFLTTSPYLEEHAPFIKNGKYFATRVGGLTLEDIITQFSEISRTVEEKLEETNYFQEHRTMTVANQLKYLLNYQKQSYPLLPNDLNATPSESLPGNSSPRRTPCTSNSKHPNAFGDVSPISHDSRENISQSIQMLSQTLLETPGLQERLADVINKVQNTAADNDEDRDSALSALDSKIKNMVEEADHDPVFDELLDEIIGTRTDIPDQVSSQTDSDVLNSSIGGASNIAESIKKKDTSSTSVSTEKNTSVEKGSTQASDVIIFNGNLDSYVGSTNAVVPPPNPPMYLASTPSGLFLLPSIIGAPNYFMVPTPTNNVGSVLTDTDIMKMQTVILDDRSSHQRLSPGAPRMKTLKPSEGLPDVSNGEENTITSEDEVVRSSKKEITEKVVSRKKMPRQAKTKRDPSPAESKRKIPNTPPTISSAKTVTPKSSTHVRTLNFETPNKDQKIVEGTASKRKSQGAKNVASKYLFKADEKAAGKTWDAELRELLVPKEIQRDDSHEKDVDSDLDMTCEEEEIAKNAKIIEDAFKTPAKKDTEKTIENLEEPKEIVNLDVQKDKSTNEPIDTTDNPSAGNATEKTDKNKEEIDENENTTGDKYKEEINQETKTDSIQTVIVEQTAVYLRNLNAPPRFRKKCNVTNYPVQEYEIEMTYEKEETTKTSFSDPKTTTTTNNVILETPVKETVPVTPGKTELTPFSRALEDQLRGMDLLSIPTPSLSITPSFPLTPGINLITPTHSNRPTDYSTSSSYYQPSDTEQNKSLEVLMKECKRLESSKSSIENEDATKNTNKQNESGEIPNTNELKRMFNENVIGKKNLSLLKRRNSSSCSSDSDSSYSESSSSSDSESSESEVENITSKPDESKRGSYSLRKRPVVTTPKPTPKINKTITKKTPKKFKSFNEEISDKRERVKRSLKREVKKTPSTPASKNKDKQTKKQEVVEEKQIVHQLLKLNDVENEITDDDFALHLSTDEETTNKLEPGNVAIEDRLKKSVLGVDKETPSDLEAEKLVQGLKERGILLVHKKSPKKNDVIDDNICDPTSDALKEVSTLEGNSELEISGCETVVNLSTNEIDVTFDIKCIEEEDLKIIHSTTKKKSKKFVYDSAVLEKEMKADVYVESLNVEMVRTIKCTPFELLFEFLPKNTKSKARKPAEKKVKKDEENKNCQTTKKKTTKSKEKTVAAKTEKKQSKSKTVKNDKNKDGVNILSDVKLSGDVKNHNEGLLSVEYGASPALRTSDDELMNYAVLGSQRKENSESPKAGSKRKNSSEDNEPVEKKFKTEQHQALLKKIDVDVFLNKVHGKAKQS